VLSLDGFRSASHRARSSSKASVERLRRANCFDYGNAEIDSRDDDNGTMETTYYGNATAWYRGSGPGPWIMTNQAAKRLQFSPRCPHLSSYLSSPLYW
jgi:Alpha-L-arabinofuranosidase B, catalytic